MRIPQSCIKPSIYCQFLGNTSHRRNKHPVCSVLNISPRHPVGLYQTTDLMCSVIFLFFFFSVPSPPPEAGWCQERFAGCCCEYHGPGRRPSGGGNWIQYGSGITSWFNDMETSCIYWHFLRGIHWCPQNDGWVQERCNCSALAMELRLSRKKPSTKGQEWGTWTFSLFLS